MSENQSGEVTPEPRQQEELPLAIVQGQAIDSLPTDKLAADNYRMTESPVPEIGDDEM